MRKLIYILIINFFWACSPEELNTGVCLEGSCDAEFFIDEQVQPNAYQDNNGYWHIEYYGPKYFTIRGELDEMEFEVNNVPLVETQYDSDYWIAFDSITFTVPTWSVLSWFTGGGFNNPVPVGDLTYTLTDLAQAQPPLNIAGYQIQKNFCWECPYAETLLGSKSKYNYSPRQQFFLDNRMVGDTLQVFVKAIFNTDVGPRESVEQNFKIIVE
jgi:hypothetical protein